MKNIIKYINFGLAVLKARLTGKNIPILVVICVTNRCNLRCAYCYQRSFEEKNSEFASAEFTTSEILSLIDELGEMGTKFISINGGEALLRNDLEAIIDKVNEKKMLCQLTTNGQLIKNKINIIKKVSSLCVSLDGNKESHESNRGKGSYDRIIEGLEYLNTNNISFHTNTTITKNNLNAIDEVMALAKKYNFKAQFSLLREEDAPDKNLGLSDDEIRKIIKQIITYKKKRLPIFYSYDSYKNALNWPFSYSQQTIFGKLPPGYKAGPCYVKRLTCQIEADGSVYPCVTLVGKFKTLNLKKVGFKAAWENLKNYDCLACYNICHNDLNGVFGLGPNTLWNAVKIIARRIIR